MNHTANRDYWTFDYPAGAVADAARARADHHVDRQTWWENERDMAEGQLRSTGVEFRDREMTGGARVEAVIDPELRSRYEECRRNVTEHKRRADEYETFAEVLSANGEDMLELTVGDVAYFGLA